MIKKLLIPIICVICLFSCVSTKVSFKNQFDFSVLRENNFYIIETKNDEKLRHFKITSQSDDSITGIYKGSEVEIKKASIETIKKPSTAKTVGLVAGSVGLFFIVSAIPAAVSN